MELWSGGVTQNLFCRNADFNRQACGKRASPNKHRTWDEFVMVRVVRVNLNFEMEWWSGGYLALGLGRRFAIFNF